MYPLPSPPVPHTNGAVVPSRYKKATMDLQVCACMSLEQADLLVGKISIFDDNVTVFACYVFSV